MKKLLATTLVGAMMMSMSVTAFADTITIDGTQNANTVVTYGPQGGYTVVIPESVVIDNQTDKGSAVLSAENVMIDFGKVLNITISGDDYDDAWELIDHNDASNIVEYIIGKTEGASDVVNNTIVLSSGAGANWNSKTEQMLYFKINEDVEKTGNYEDTLTFTVTVD